MTIRSRIANWLVGESDLVRASSPTNLDPEFFMSLVAKRAGGSVVKNPYKQLAVVYACIRLIADNLSGVRWVIVEEDRETSKRDMHPRLRWDEFNRSRFYTREKDFFARDVLRLDEGVKEVTSGSLVDLFVDPNPNLAGAVQFWDAVTTILMNRGGTYIICNDREVITDVPDELWPENPGNFRLIKRNGIPVGWHFRKGSISKDLLSYQLIRPRFINPDDLIGVQAPYEAGKKEGDASFKSAVFNNKFFDNDATIGGNIEMPAGYTRKQRKGKKEQFDETHLGAWNAGEWSVSSGAFKVTPHKVPHKDMMYDAQMEWSKKTFAMIYRVALSLLAEPAANFATSQRDEKNLWANTLVPLGRMIEEVFYSDLFRWVEGGRFWGVFDFSQVEALQEDLKDKLESAKIMNDLTYSPNMINNRLKLGMESTPWGDVPLVNQSQVPITWQMDPVNLAAKNTGTQPGGESGDRGAGVGMGSVPATQNDDDLCPSSHSSGPGLDTRVTQKQLQARREFLKARKGDENTFHSKYRRYIFEMRRELLKNVEEHYKPPPRSERQTLTPAEAAMMQEMLFAEEKWDEALRGVTKPLYEQSFITGAATTAKQLGAGIITDLTNPDVIRFLKQKEISIVETNQTLRNNLKLEIAKGINEGDSISAMQGRIRKVMNFQESRALTIARTEVGQVTSTARNMEMKAQGVEETLWVTAGEGAKPKPRDAHLDAEAMGAVPMGEVFGRTQCRWPLDPKGPADQVINCRCVNVPV